MNDLARIKSIVRLWDVFERDGHQISRHGMCSCPFHEDRTPSCKVDDHRFHCFGCGADGDVIEYIQRRDGCDFKEATAKLGVIGVASPVPDLRRNNPSTKSAPVCATPATLTDDECRRGLRMAEELIGNPQLCEQIARTRNWRSETVLNLAREASLGVEDGKLAFLYDTGVKLRSRKETGERIIWWAFGKPSLWRGAFLPSATTVYLCEGETDAISLIDAGVETDLKTLVIAMPSASTFSERWAHLFRGKHLILAMDSDEAGRKATDTVARLLARHVASLKQLNWEGMQHAC